MLEIVVIDVIWCRVTSQYLDFGKVGVRNLAHNSPRVVLISVGEYHRTSFQL